MNVTMYDAKDTTIMVDGVYITGLGEDMVTGEKDEDLRSDSVGAKGDVVSSVINNSLGQITISVQPTSPQMAFLLELAKRTDFFPVWVINKKLGVRLGGTKASLMSLPEIALGAEAEDREFAFRIYDYDVQVA